MSSDDTAFLQVLESCTEAAAGMDLSDDGFAPPNGTYDVMVSNITTGTKESGGINNSWVRPTFTILTDLRGEFEGQTFTNLFWIPGVINDKNGMGLKRLLQFATCLASTEVRNPIEAVEIANASVGEIVSVEVYRTTTKKGQNAGKEYVNTRYLRKLVPQEDETVGANASMPE